MIGAAAGAGIGAVLGLLMYSAHAGWAIVMAPLPLIAWSKVSGGGNAGPWVMALFVALSYCVYGAILAAAGRRWWQVVLGIAVFHVLCAAYFLACVGLRIGVG